MSEEKGEEWELSKENIRPIQQGRKQKVLKVALAAHPEDAIVQQRQSFENELRTYSGDDPLVVWCKYIKWVEQNFPKGGREGHIKQLIERCLSILKNEKRYYDDDRFIDIMLKYAIISGKPTDVYDYMFSNNIGCKSANFFVNWSWELEQFGNIKKADDILNEGIRRKAEPFEEMQSYFKDFEIRLASKIKANSERNPSESENDRSAFAILKPQKKNLAPILRTGEAVIENKKMPLVLGRQQPQPKSIDTSVKIPFKIHDSENINPSLPIQSQSAVPSNLNSENYKENEQKPGKWCKGKMKAHDKYLMKTLHEAKPPFKFHCDDENEQEINTPRSVPKISKILSIRSKTPSPPMALFEPPDPLKKPMYPKSKVYGGAEEFSLEEIRAAEWFDKRKKIEHDKLLIEQQQKIEEQQVKEEELKKQVEYLAKQVELLQNQVMSSVPKSSDSTELNTKSNSLQSVKAENNESNKKLEMEKSNIRKNFENSLTHIHSNLQNDADIQSTHESNNMLSSKNKTSANPSVLDTFENKSTDAAGFCKNAKLVQEFYNRTLSHSRNESECKENMNKELGEKCSTIFSSDLNEASQHEEVQNSVLKESNSNLPFIFYHDPTGVIANSNEVAPIPYRNKEDAILPPDEVSSEEDVENIPPKGYVQETTKRELAGILEPSKNIPFIPVEEQEETDDNSDNSDIEDDFVCPSERQYTDDTLIPPSNTEQFSAAKFLSSTPFIPRNKSPIMEKSEHQIAPSEANDIPINEHLPTEIPDLVREEFKSDQDTIIRTELKPAQEQNCLPILPKILSVIMETSSEAYSKSSSSSSASLTRSNNLDQLSNHRISMFKQYSKTEACELSSVSEVSNSISALNCQDTSVIPHTEFNKKDEKVQLCAVDSDPFDQKRNRKFLHYIRISDYKNLYFINNTLKVYKVGENICIGKKSYRIITHIADGAYARVFEADECAFVSCENNKKVALKVCKKSDEWEFYICNELQKRLSEYKHLPDVRNSVMNVTSAGKFSNGIILVTDFGKYGTLLDIINLCRAQNTAMPELIVMYFTLEILHIVSKLHECNIIHGDLKPDNFLLTNNAFDRNSVENLSEGVTSLQLIDFGRAIDLNFYDKGTCFTSVFSKADFKCNEMKDKKPWVFQLDWYGVASCIYTMLFSDYMVVRKRDDVWRIEKKLKRYWCVSLWDTLFNKLLNIPECYQEPDVKSEISIIESKLQQNSVNFLNQFIRFSRSYPTGK